MLTGALSYPPFVRVSLRKYLNLDFKDNWQPISLTGRSTHFISILLSILKENDGSFLHTIIFISCLATVNHVSPSVFLS